VIIFLQKPKTSLNIYEMSSYIYEIDINLKYYYLGVFNKLLLQLKHVDKGSDYYFLSIARLRLVQAYGHLVEVRLPEINNSSKNKIDTIANEELVELAKGETLKKKIYWQYSPVIADTITGFTRNVQRAARIHLDQSSVLYGRPTLPMSAQGGKPNSHY
jgi:hypothetical protein